jgi:hypothetical protein
MKKFVFLYMGQAQTEAPTAEGMKAWGDWFASVGEHLVDSGNPFGTGREVTSGGAIDLGAEASSITGYSIVTAADLDAAQKLLDGCPIGTGVRVYEAMPM